MLRLGRVNPSRCSRARITVRGRFGDGLIRVDDAGGSDRTTRVGLQSTIGGVMGWPTRNNYRPGPVSDRKSTHPMPDLRRGEQRRIRVRADRGAGVDRTVLVGRPLLGGVGTTNNGPTRNACSIAGCLRGPRNAQLSVTDANIRTVIWATVVRFWFRLRSASRFQQRWLCHTGIESKANQTQNRIRICRTGRTSVNWLRQSNRSSPVFVLRLHVPQRHPPSAAIQARSLHTHRGSPR